MIMLNTMTGMPRKQVRAKITATVVLTVGGTDDADRVDSVQELFNDHDEEITGSIAEWFKDGLESTEIHDIEVLEEGGGYGE